MRYRNSGQGSGILQCLGALVALALPLALITTPAAGALNPFFSDSRFISLSVDAIARTGEVSTGEGIARRHLT